MLNFYRHQLIIEKLTEPFSSTVKALVIFIFSFLVDIVDLRWGYVPLIQAVNMSTEQGWVCHFCLYQKEPQYFFTIQKNVLIYY